MKKFFAFLLVFGVFNINMAVFAIEDLTLPANFELQPAQNSEVSMTKVNDDAPKWEEYVAPKYRNPRTDFKKGSAITETAIGGVLTSLILTAPIGIPMIIHGTTKIKMVSYANRKNIFDEEIAKAKLIQNDSLRAEAYAHTLKRCHLKESTRQHYAKKEAKARAKDAKKKK